MEAQGQYSSESEASALSIVIPVFNEESRIGQTAECLLRDLPGNAEVVFICNGCTDRSVEILQDVVRDRALILELAVPNKSAAIRQAERHLTRFPRFYVDSDVVIEGSAIVSLAETLRRDRLEMISPRVDPDLTDASWSARAISRIWYALPHGVHGAFHGVIGISKEGRSRWGEMPDVLADDSFMEAQIPFHLKAVDQDVSQISIPPRTFWSAVRVRERWAAGQRELASRGTRVATVPGQRRALLAFLFSRSDFPAACVYLGARLIAAGLARIGGPHRRPWYHDRTSRPQRH